MAQEENFSKVAIMPKRVSYLVIRIFILQYLILVTFNFKNICPGPGYHGILRRTLNPPPTCLSEPELAGDGVGELSAAEEGPELELELDVVAGLAALDGDLAAELHGHGAHQDALAVRVRHRHQVVLAAGQQAHLYIDRCSLDEEENNFFWCCA